MERHSEMKNVALTIFLSLFLVGLSQPIQARIICEEEGYDQHGLWDYCLRAKVVPGKEPRRDYGRVEYPNEGQPERIDKHIDGSVSVWITGNPEPQEWKPDGKDSWVRTR